MDRMYRHQRHVYDLSRKYYLLGRDHLIARLAPGPGQSVLEIACGTGRNLIAASRRYPQAHFHGLDQADATRVDAMALFDTARFDRVFISYSLSMIPAWREVLAGAAGLLAPH